MNQKVKAIPEGFHTLSPHITVKDGGAAIEFYKKAFGAEEIDRSLMPDGKTLMHATLKIGDSLFMLNDEFPENGVLSPQSIKGTAVILHIYLENVDALWEQAVAAGAKSLFPLQDCFWGDRYGQLEDPFGHKWSLATHIANPTAEEMARQAKEMFGDRNSSIAK